MSREPSDLCEMCEQPCKLAREDRDCPECAAIRAELECGATPAEALHRSVTGWETLAKRRKP